jgi:uncharacterized membrane protein (DUF2068 family)
VVDSPVPSSSRHVAPIPRNDAGLRLITAYKLVKGVGQLALAVVLFAAVELGVAVDWLRDAVFFARHHFASATSVKLAELLLQIATPKHLGLTALALALDGALTTCEGVALSRRLWWAPWLVVVATGSFLPYEVYELIREPRGGRLLLFALNALVVVYLASRALRERRERRHATKTPTPPGAPAPRA